MHIGAWGQFHLANYQDNVVACFGVYLDLQVQMALHALIANQNTRRILAVYSPVVCICAKSLRVDAWKGDKISQSLVNMLGNEQIKRLTEKGICYFSFLWKSRFKHLEYKNNIIGCLKIFWRFFMQNIATKAPDGLCYTLY